MRVLLSATTPSGDAADVADRLRRAGHTVYGCRGGERCTLAMGGTCPLADHLVDAHVHVRERPGPPSGRDRPFLCAVVAGTPLVLCGPPSPEGPWSRADVACTPSGVVGALEQAVRRRAGTASAGGRWDQPRSA